MLWRIAYLWNWYCMVFNDKCLKCCDALQLPCLFLSPPCVHHQCCVFSAAVVLRDAWLQLLKHLHKENYIYVFITSMIELLKNITEEVGLWFTLFPPWNSSVPCFLPLQRKVLTLMAVLTLASAEIPGKARPLHLPACVLLSWRPAFFHGWPSLTVGGTTMYGSQCDELWVPPCSSWRRWWGRWQSPVRSQSGASSGATCWAGT